MATFQSHLLAPSLRNSLARGQWRDLDSEFDSIGHLVGVGDAKDA